jgi:hypothetical protein
MLAEEIMASLFRKLLSSMIILTLLLGISLAEEVLVVITKVEGNRVTFAESKGPGGKGPEKTLPVADKLKVIAKSKLNKDTRTREGGGVMAEGLKADLFARIDARGVRATIALKEDQITEIRVGDIPRKLPDRVQTLLEKAPEFALYSLDPDVQEKPANEPGALHGWKVLGKTTVKEQVARRQLLAELDRGLTSPDARAARCFEPRHALRVIHDGASADLVICFACGQVYIYLDGKPQLVTSLIIDRAAQPAFDEALRKAGIPLAKRQN